MLDYTAQLKRLHRVNDGRGFHLTRFTTYIEEGLIP